VQTRNTALRVVALLLGLSIAGQAVAESADAAERSAFIEQRLDEGRAWARLWQNGWTTAYAGAAVVHTALAFAGDDQDEQVVNGVSALRAVAALALISHRPDPGRYGADPVRAAGPPGSTARIAEAERLLAATVHHADRRYSVGRHLFNVGLNAAFGGLVWAFGDSDDAIKSTLLGIAGGEAALLSRSRQPIRNARDYESRFGAPVTWEFVPRHGGLAVVIRF
jgi:hypothetical protein